MNRSVFSLLLTCSLLFLSYSNLQAQSSSGSPKDTLQHRTEATPSQNTIVPEQPDPTQQGSITDTIHYEADHIDYDAAGKRLSLTGNARISYQNLTLIADSIVYEIDQSIFIASGLPQLIESGDTTVGDYMVYNIETRRGKVNHASTHLDDAFFNGQQIIKSADNELYVDAGDYTTCAHIDTPDYYFYGRNIKIVPNDKIISRPVVFNVGDAPVLYLPFFIFPTKRNRRSGFLTPIWGGQPTSGGYLDNIGYYYAPNDYVDFTLKGRVYEFSEFVMEGASSYRKKYDFNGSVSGRYALNSNFNNQKKEWALNYSHNQNLTPDGKTQLSGQGRLISQKNLYQGNFYQLYSINTKELIEQKISANASLSRELTSINGRTNLSYNRSHNLSTDNIAEDLPSLTFNLPSRPLILHEPATGTSTDSLKWYHNIYWGYDAQGIVRHNKYGNDSLLETFHPGVSQKVSFSAPQKLFSYITVSPQFSGQAATFYGYTDTNVLRYDTTYDTVQYAINKAASAANEYSDYTFLKGDTTFDSYGFIDSARITKRRLHSEAVYLEHNDAFKSVSSWNTGVSMSTNLYGVLPIRFLNFAGLRHTLSPAVSYTFTPEQNLDKKFYDVGIGYDRPHKRSQQVGLNVSNQFDGKLLYKGSNDGKPTEKKVSIVSFNLGTGYDFEAETRKWSDLSLSAATGFNILRLTYNSSHWLYNQRNQLAMPLMRSMSINLGAGALSAKGSLWGGDLLVLDSLQPDDPASYANVNLKQWSISMTPSYSYSLTRSSPTEMFTPTKNYGLSANAGLNFTRNWSAQWSSTYNFNTDQWVQNSINLACDLECWDMRFQWRPEKLNPGYYFVVNIKKIPEIKWEKRQ